MRQGILFSLVTALTVLVLGSSAAGAQERASCPNGFSAYAVPQSERTSSSSPGSPPAWPPIPRRTPP